MNAKVTSSQIPSSRPSLGEREEAYVLEALRSSWVSSRGEFLDRLETGLQEFLGVPQVVLVSNGTNALHLALAALRVAPGDEVLVPDLTFAASANAVMLCGATPVLLDSQADHWNLDPAELERALTARTKGVMAVHLLGHACQMPVLREFCRANGLWLMEDCAEALGSTYGPDKVGGLSQAGCFSFFANKVMTTGEGGFCCTRDAGLAARMRQLRGHGMSGAKPYWHETTGFNYRLTNLQAALGLAQLERLPQMLERRRQVTRLYDQGLADLPVYRTQFTAPGVVSDWLYPLFIANPGPPRDKVLQGLRNAGVDARPMFYPLHQMPPYVNLPRTGDMPQATAWSASGLLLPLFPDLQEEQVRRIVDLLRRLAG